MQCMGEDSARPTAVAEACRINHLPNELDHLPNELDHLPNEFILMVLAHVKPRRGRRSPYFNQDCIPLLHLCDEPLKTFSCIDAIHTAEHWDLGTTR